MHLAKWPDRPANYKFKGSGVHYSAQLIEKTPFYLAIAAKLRTGH